MRKTIVFALIGILLPGVAAVSADTSPSDAALRALVSASEAAINKREFAASAAMFTTDGDVIAFDSPRDVGRDIIRRGFESSWKDQPASCRIALSVDSIRYLGPDVALVEDTATFTGCKDAPPDRATFVVVRRDGKWLIAALRIFAPLKQP